VGLRPFALLVGLMLVASACSSSGSESSATTAAGGGETSQPAGGATAVVNLENGETFAFSILCALEPQEAAGQTILFTVVSYDDPNNLDVTQFGADSLNGAASISIFDSTTYDSVWDASTFFGSEVVLELNGSTVTGAGEFYPEGDIAREAVNGELEATC